MTPDERTRDKFYSSGTWKRARARFLKLNPLCERCDRLFGLVVPATVAHHDPEMKDLPRSRWTDHSVLHPLCATCHGAVHANG